MASNARQEFISYLGQRVKAIQDDLSGVREDMAIWAGLDAEIRSRRNQVFKISGDAQANTAEFETNQAALRAKLAEFAVRVKGAIQKPGKEYLIAILNEWNKNNLPEQVAAAITVYQDVIALLRRNKNRLPPETDLWGLVEEALVSPAAAMPQIWLETDALFTGRQEDPRALSAVDTLASELRNRFRINLLDAEPGLFESNASLTARLKGEIGERVSQADEARERVVAALANVADVLAHLAEMKDELKPEEIREAIRRALIVPLKAVPGACYQDETVPEALKKLRPFVKFDAQNMGDEVEKRILEQLGQSLPDIFSSTEQAASHPCGAPCRSQEGRCHRRTSEEYCYQHGEAPGADAQPLAGKWSMSGVQTGIEHSDWEADLVLDKSGTAHWKQTKGANAGASRTGRWLWAKGVFSLVYRAPHTGRVEWQASVCSAQTISMGGEYRTPEVSPAGMGWGGTWSASRRSAG